MLAQTSIGRMIMSYIDADRPAEKIASASPVFNADEARVACDSLTKLAGLPYKEDCVDASREVMKLASSVLSDAITYIRASEDRISKLEKFAEIHSIIDDMLSKGIINTGDEREKIAELLEHENLSVVKQAMDMMGGKKGHIFFDFDGEIQQQGHEKRSMFDGVLS